MNSSKSFDFIVTKKCNSFLSPAIDPITKAISWVPLSVFGSFFLVLAISLLDEKNGVKLFSVTAVAIILHFVISEGILKIGGKKIGLFRQRPYVAHPEEIKPIGGKFSDSSFPSSHVASTVAILSTLVFFYPSFIILAILIALIVGFARLHNGMHYPSDIIAGIILGIVYASVALFLMNIFI